MEYLMECIGIRRVQLPVDFEVRTFRLAARAQQDAEISWPAALCVCVETFGIGKTWYSPLTSQRLLASNTFKLKFSITIDNYRYSRSIAFCFCWPVNCPIGAAIDRSTMHRPHSVVVDLVVVANLRALRVHICGVHIVDPLKTTQSAPLNTPNTHSRT